MQLDEPNHIYYILFRMIWMKVVRSMTLSIKKKNPNWISSWTVCDKKARKKLSVNICRNLSICCKLYTPGTL